MKFNLKKMDLKERKMKNHPPSPEIHFYKTDFNFF